MIDDWICLYALLDFTSYSLGFGGVSVARKHLWNSGGGKGTLRKPGNRICQGRSADLAGSSRHHSNYTPRSYNKPRTEMALIHRRILNPRFK